MTAKSGFLLLLLPQILQISSCVVLRNNIENEQTSLIDQFNNYVDQTIDLMNKKPAMQSSLPLQFTRGAWGYLLLNIDYSLKLSNGSITGINNLRRSGDAFISYNRSTGNLTISATVITQPVQASYTMEVEFYGRKHQGQVTNTASGLTIRVNLTVSAANLVVSLDHINVDTTQAANVTISTTNPVLNYFAPLITDLPAVSGLTEAAVKSSVQATVDVLNSPDFGYY